MPKAIRVRDVVHDQSYERAPDEPVLRVPYDLFRPEGAVRKRGDLIEWLQAGTVRSGRVAGGLLSSTQPGERVLLRISSSDPDGEWWLCEVESVDGVFGSKEA